MTVLMYIARVLLVVILKKVIYIGSYATGYIFYITVTLPHQIFRSQTCGLANIQSHWGHMYDMALQLDWRPDWNWGMMDTGDENQGKWEQREWWWFSRAKPSIGSHDGLHCLLIWRTWMPVLVQHPWHHYPTSLPEWAYWGTNYPPCSQRSTHSPGIQPAPSEDMLEPGYPHLTRSWTSIVQQGWLLLCCCARTFRQLVMLVQVDCLLQMLVHHCLAHCQRSIPLPAFPPMPGGPRKWPDQNKGLDFGVLGLLHPHSLGSIPVPTSALIPHHFWKAAVVNGKLSVLVHLHLHCLSSTLTRAFAQQSHLPHPHMSTTCLDLHAVLGKWSG